MFLNTLKNDKYVSVPEIAFDFSELVDSGLILGTFLLTNFTISGLDTLTSDLLNIQSTLDEDGYNYVCVYIPTEYLTLTTEYDADIGVADEIPLYGEGTFRYTLSDIDYNVCLTADFDVGYVYNVVAHLLYRHNPIELTGWWRNRQATEIIEKLVNVLDMLFAMWSSYNPNHASCVISPIIQYLVNNNIEYENNTITFNTTCLQEILTEVNHDETSNLEYKLFSTMKTNNDDIVLDSFLDKNQYTVVDWIKSAFSYITNVLDNE
ncbi:hypothetical protein NQ317_005353 [Molorchus minor]|uniref:Uncharacterized protein n=1 Tax=Molorchus minor TaxID=1323400 RepID=A0ABQ9JPS0_9CUCU|nr:hypothetical protein NQ317_005353 [Molorchus minor]